MHPHWNSFYTEFEQYDPVHNIPYYELEHFLIGATILTHDDARTKAEFVFDIVSSRTKTDQLNRRQVRHVLMQFFEVACNHVPKLANTYPYNQDKLKRLVSGWKTYYPSLVSTAVAAYMGKAHTITRDDFIAKSCTSPFS